MFKLRNVKMLWTKWAYLILMPATGLKFVGTRACLPWCSISSSFQNSLKMSGHRGYNFWSFGFGIWSHSCLIGFQLLKSSWSSLMYFSLNDAPNVLYSLIRLTCGWILVKLDICSLKFSFAPETFSGVYSFLHHPNLSKTENFVL